MITIRSYLRAGDGTFEQVEVCTAPPDDPDYVEGAVEMIINGTEIIGKAQWDYVDQLWSYIATMARKLSFESEASTYFPDQPVLLKFTKHGSRVRVSSKVSSGTRQASVDTVELIDALRNAGTSFFSKMSELVPSNLDGYGVALSNLSD